ncbi:S9 family peptidase [Actinopolymorpha rutila]|uniref:Dipeptidyl aminopeptidase/acylaminoacyl peptidase n=1 Tax=Actinopolymorpha rutila TaxID=446787 RepID=A0A852ZE73_9ACTN|nr:S9 family peptidase [Actinopolymorpha rutila]NYH91204.1 dipeptidyl aminopeptidase/acylaminoacyl peptidase [Actinopolymorpha rutila]
MTDPQTHRRLGRTDGPGLPVPLIPRAVLYGSPYRSTPELSPDGTRIGYLAPVEGVLNVWIGPLDESSPARPVTTDRGKGIQMFGFCHDDRTLIYLQDHDGDENWRLYALDLETGETRCVTPAATQARLLAHTHRHPTTLLIALNKDNPKLHDVWGYDLRTGQLSLVEHNPGFASWLVDSDLSVRGGTTMSEDGGIVIHLRTDGTGGFRPWRELPTAEGAAGGDVLGFTRDGRLLLLTSYDSNAAKLISVDTDTGAEQVLAADAEVDITRVVLHPETLEPQAVVVTRDREEWTFLDPDFEAAFARMRATIDVDGELGIGRSVGDDGTWLVSVTPSDGPLRYYVHDRTTARTRLLFTVQPDLEHFRLARVEPYDIVSRDGLRVHGYVTFPPGVPRHDQPAVLYVHGGPWSRDFWTYNPDVQWLANRGYVCVQVNFRGSKGYGKAFCSAGDKEWAGRMHDDLVDALDYCVSEGWVDPERVAIMGSSYGGYAALVGAAFTPDLFCCAIDLCGPSNLLTLVESIPPYWRPMVAFMHAKIGDPVVERDLLWSRSPLCRINAIRIPVLIGHGANDPRVKQREAEQIVEALRARGVPHEYLLFPDEGHGLVDPMNRERFYAAAERFLAEHLGGRAEG